MREQRRACAVFGLGPFAGSVIEGLAPSAFSGPVASLRLATASSRAGHDWLPRGLRGPVAPPLLGTRAGARLDVITSGRAAIAAHEPALRVFRERCEAASVPATVVLVVGLFDPHAAGALDLAALLRASESFGDASIALVGVLAPPAGEVEPAASSRAALTLVELDRALAGSPWELPQPSGVLSTAQAGSPFDSTMLLWPSGPRWTADEATAATADVLHSLPWLPELPGGGLGAARSLPVRAPAADVRERLADRLAAVAIDRWLSPGAAEIAPAEVAARLLAGPPSAQTEWIDGVRARVAAIVHAAEELAASEPDAAANRVRGAVPALDREVQAELASKGPLRLSADDAARRWVAGAQAQAVALADELCATSDGGGFALIALCQRGPEWLAEQREQREKDVGRADPGAAREELDRATEALREAIDKPAGLSIRLLGRGAPRLLAPLRAWQAAFEAWADAHWRGVTARVEAGALGMLLSAARVAANQVQEFEVQLRQAGDSVRRAGRAANQRPSRGVVVLPGGAVDPDEAAERLEHLGAQAGGGWLTAAHLLDDPSPRILSLQDRLRTRLGAAEAQLTLAGALGSLPESGPSRDALDKVVLAASAPLLAGEGREELVAVLPQDVRPDHLGLPEGTLIVRAPRAEDALLVRLAGGFEGAALGLRKAALDEGLSRLAAREPEHPDLQWRRFGR